MAKYAVITICIGEVYDKIGALTHPTIKAYAERIGADFIVIKESQCSTPHWEKFNAIYENLNKYERILYIDSDVIVRRDAPSIFDAVPKDKLGMFNEMPFTSQRHLSIYDSCKEYGITLKNWNGKYYNTGVMVVPRMFKYLFKKPERELFSFYEQGYFNAILAKHLDRAGNELAVFDLPYQFNRMTCMDQFTGEERFASYFIHYAGYPSLEFVLNLIKEDLKKWQNAKDFSYKRHVLINVQGGLGDQVCAEPVIRFMREKIYKEEDLTVITHFPRLFSHFKDLNLPVYSHDEFRFQRDTPYYHLLSLPGPETLLWSCISHLLSHSVDYIAIALLKRTLPNEDKRIKLEVYPEEIDEVKEILGLNNLKDLVLVHPGRHWESKTFPTEWWQKVIDETQKAGLKVCIIGQEEETRGTVPIEVRDEMIDSRNLLTIGHLIALISEAKVLVSNDSAPIHLAGAFDNGIILIPTCKHADHLLPFRHKSQYFRAKALHKKEMCYDYISAPNTLKETSADYLPGDYYDYLPDIETVVKNIQELYVQDVKKLCN